MQDRDAVRRKRLHFQSHHRGTKELDLLLGRFADRHLAALGDAELDQYEALLAAPDPDLFNWITGSAAPPAEHDSGVMARLVAIYRGDGN